jgi:hypothetical protein
MYPPEVIIPKHHLCFTDHRLSRNFMLKWRRRIPIKLRATKKIIPWLRTHLQISSLWRVTRNKNSYCIRPNKKTTMSGPFRKLGFHTMSKASWLTIFQSFKLKSTLQGTLQTGHKLCLTNSVDIYLFVCRDSVVVNVTRYRLDGPGSNPGGTRFSALVQTDPGANLASYKMCTESLYRR